MYTSSVTDEKKYTHFEVSLLNFGISFQFVGSVVRNSIVFGKVATSLNAPKANTELFDRVRFNQKKNSKHSYLPVYGLTIKKVQNIVFLNMYGLTPKKFKT